MGKMGSATCMICGRELPVEKMEVTFTGRVKYRCYECIADGEKQIAARVSASLNNGFAKRLRERNEWK